MRIPFFGTVYRRGNCYEAFKNEQKLRDHIDAVCPWLRASREVANWNRQAGAMVFFKQATTP